MVSTVEERLYDVGTLDNIPPGEGRTVLVGHVPLALFRTRSGDLYATQARCPHKGGPLVDGIVGATTLVCPLHEFKFDLCSGRSIGDECKAIKTYPVRVTGTGRILVALTPLGANPTEPRREQG